MLPVETPRAYNFAFPYGSMWVIFGQSAVLPKKSDQPVPGFELGTLYSSARPLVTRPPPPLLTTVTTTTITTSTTTTNNNNNNNNVQPHSPYVHQIGIHAPW